MKSIVHYSFALGAGLVLTGCGSDVAAPTIDDPSPVVGEVVQVDDLATPPQEPVESDDLAVEKAVAATLEEVIGASDVAPVELLDVSGGNASGKAWTVLGPDQKTYHRVVAQNMPPLEEDYFYEGWLVRAPSEGNFFSTGEMIPGANEGDFLLEYTGDGDFLDHAKVVITLEPDDGDPAPAAHIIEN